MSFIVWGLTIALCQQQEIPNTQKEEIPFTPPHKALEAIEVPAGFEVTLFAHEPDVHQPIAMTFDAKGRLWVVENYTYSDRKENFNEDLNDRVVIFDDVDNDGKFDTRKIFWDQGKKLTGIEIGRGGVWLTAAPEFIFIPDADRDDVPDGPPQVILDGFEDDAVRHNIVNGLRWGPDGWLYSRHGIMANSYVGRPGATQSQRTPMNCCVWRYHPELDVLEIVAEGGTNFWGLDFDEHGEIFVINTVIGHLFHIVPGARFDRMYGAHFNPYTWQTIEQTADHFHFAKNEKWQDAKKSLAKNGGLSDGTDLAGGGHAHSGFMIYLGESWPDRFRGNAMTLNFHGRRINTEDLQRSGNSYVGKHGPDMFRTSDPWFRGVELAYGPDGSVFVLDWSDIGECHESDGIHRTSGRIFKLAYGKPKKPEFDDLFQLPEPKLIELLSSKNEWLARTARRVLIDRQIAKGNAKQLPFPEGFERILEIANGGTNVSASGRIKAISVVSELKGQQFSEKFLLKDLERFASADDEHVRAFCVRMAAGLQVTNIGPFLEKMAADPSPLVRLYVASSINRLSPKDAFTVAKKLVSFEADRQDRVQPKLIWYRIEPFVADNFDAAIELLSACQSKMLRQNIARRLACDPQRQDETLEKLVQVVLSDPQPHVEDILIGIEQAVAGRKQMSPPPSWAKLTANVTGLDNQSAELVRSISPVFGDGLSIERLMKLASDGNADPMARRQAILSLSQYAEPKDLFPDFSKLLGNKLVGGTVAKAIAVCNEPQVADLVLKRFRGYTAVGKRNAIDTLCSRKEWATKLLAAIDRGRVPISMFTASHSRQIRLFDDPQLTKQLTEVWGTVRDSDADMLAAMSALRRKISPEVIATADLAKGKTLFTRHCASCHVMFGEGGNIGPDLTGADRKNLNYLLENIVDPSASVATTWRASVLAMEDGRLLTGVVLNKTAQTLVLQTKDEQLTLEVSSIESIKRTELSLMPSGLLQTLSERETVDLFGYLMSP